MALFKTGAFVTQISGKIGGTSFAISKGGNYMKNSGGQIKPRTNSQARIKSQFGSIAQLWRELPEPARTEFQTQTVNYPYINRVGETCYLSGFALFCKMNNGMLNIGHSPVLKPPAPSVLFPPLYDVFSSEETELILAFEDADENAAYQVYATPALSIGVNNPYKYFKRITVINSPSSSSGDDILEDYIEVFGDLAVNTTIFIMVIATSVINGISTAKNQFVKFTNNWMTQLP